MVLTGAMRDIRGQAVATGFAFFSLLSVCIGLRYDSASVHAEALAFSEVKADLSAANLDILEPSLNPDPTLALGGGDIVIEDGSVLVAESGTLGTIVEVEQQHRAGIITVYEVREGDSLSQIADMFGVSVNTIKWANSLDGAIKEGQKLVILPVSGLSYTVKKKDTLASIAKAHEADASEIALFNGIADEAELVVGDSIIIPNAETNPAQQPKKAATKAKAVNKVGSAVVATGYYGNPAPNAVLTQGIHGYNGIDMGAAVGTSIYAAAPGSVILAKNDGGWNGGYGNYVIISHSNGTQTLYAHLSSVSVSVGDEVARGDYIGGMGSTGKSTGSHLHFEVRGATNPFGR
jgi:LysM repeat protein